MDYLQIKRIEELKERRFSFNLLLVGVTLGFIVTVLLTNALIFFTN